MNNIGLPYRANSKLRQEKTNQEKTNQEKTNIEKGRRIGALCFGASFTE